MHLPYADSARILVGAWWLVVLVISTTYCGNLVAFLTFPKMEKPIKTIEDIIHHRDVLSWSIPKESFFEDQLKVNQLSYLCLQLFSVFINRYPRNQNIRRFTMEKLQRGRIKGECLRKSNKANMFTLIGR